LGWVDRRQRRQRLRLWAGRFLLLALVGGKFALQPGGLLLPILPLPPLVLEGSATDDRLAVERLRRLCVVVRGLRLRGGLGLDLWLPRRWRCLWAAGGAGSCVASCASDARKLSSCSLAAMDVLGD